MELSHNNKTKDRWTKVVSGCEHVVCVCYTERWAPSPGSVLQSSDFTAGCHAWSNVSPHHGVPRCRVLARGLVYELFPCLAIKSVTVEHVFTRAWFDNQSNTVSAVCFGDVNRVQIRSSGVAFASVILAVRYVSSS